MKKVLQFFQRVLFVLLATTGAVMACDKSSLTLVNVTDLGGGQYKIVVKVCSAKGITGSAGNGPTSAWALNIVGGGATISSFSPPTVTSTQTGNTYTGNITSPTQLTYSGPGYWSDICPTCAPDGSECTTITIITNKYPTSINVTGLEGGGCTKSVNLPPILTPLSLLSFVASPLNAVIKLSWVCADEINNSYFTLERSKDGALFQEIARIAGAGNSSTTHYYTYTDINPLAGINYYRLKQTDFNGQGSYSTVITVKANVNIKSLQINPNPVKLGEFLQVYPTGLADNTTYTIQLTSPDGRLVYEQTIPTATERLSINTSELTSGMYFLRILSFEDCLTQKVLVE